MSDLALSYDSAIEISDQRIEIKTEIRNAFREVTYFLKSEKHMEPLTVALALYLMCKDVCGKINIDIEDLEEGLSDAAPASVRDQMN